MSAVLALLFIVSLILGDFGRCRRQSPRRGRDVSLPSSPSLRRAKSTHGRTTGLFVDTIVLSVLLSLSLVSCHIITTSPPEIVSAAPQETVLNDEGKRQLQVDLADPDIAMDLATMRAYETALKAELQHTDENLKRIPSNLTLLKHKQLLEVLLTNPGRTGVSDRLSAMDKAFQIVKSTAVYSQEGEAAVRRAMANLRASAASWKAGAFAIAGTCVGLHWDEREGLTTGVPYNWGENGRKCRTPAPCANL
jgi:hypothetical protein